MTAYTVPLIDHSDHASILDLIAPGALVSLERAMGDRQRIRAVSACGHPIGYVHRQSAKWIADRLEQGKFVEARIAPVVAVGAEELARRVQLSVYTEPMLADQRPWWKRLLKL
jgi:hypothetical protein